MSFTEIDIGVLAQRSDLSTATLRYYEQKGLIHSIGRKGLRRQYPLKTVDQLQLIQMAQHASLTLEEIKKIFFQQQSIQIDRQLLNNKIESVEQRIAHMQITLLTLKHIAECPYEQHLDCPTFQKILASASNE